MSIILGDYTKILLEKKEQIAIITLNQPDKLNAISLEMKSELYAALVDVEADESIHVVILTGAGRAFCSGHDNDDPMETLPEFASLKEEEKLYHLAKPTIAAVRGYALGDGAQQALLCDLIVAGEDAVIGFIGPEIGALCYGAYTVLPAVVGSRQANELLLTCKRISAREAYRIGLVNQVVPGEELMDAALEMAGSIVKLPSKSIQYTKKALRAPLATDHHLATVEEGWRDILGDLFQPE
ncbi:MAG: enoyl-CoA hydratase/isomerase family protein [Thermodesulfobacteriota bacterium]